MLENNVLIVGPSWIGDTIMAQPLFQQLKSSDPSLCIDVLAPTWTKSLYQFMPEVSRTLTLPFEHGEMKWSQRYQLARQLTTHCYQQAIILPLSLKSAFIPLFASIPWRTGWRGEMRYGLINDLRTLDPKRYPTMIQRFLALGLPKKAPPPPLLSPKITVNKTEVDGTLEKLSLNPMEKPVLVLCPGAKYGEAKRWPAEYYAQVAKQRLQEGWQVWLVGSKEDQPLSQTIQQICRHRCLDFTGKIPLTEAIHLLSVCQQVVANDSGLTHLASALDKPLVAIYGSTSPHYAPPLNQHHARLYLNLPCSPCRKRVCPLQHLRCMRDIYPQSVLDALNALLP